MMQGARLTCVACTLAVVAHASCGEPRDVHSEDLGVASSSSTGTVAVSSQANIFAAGLSGGPPMIAIGPGAHRVISFATQTAGISCCGTAGSHGADGGDNLSTHITPDPPNGISGIQHDSKNIFLIGLFADDAGPVTASPPSELHYFSPGQVVSGTTSDAEPSYSPLLDQTFFIGDGLAGPATGERQSFEVPASATRLFLGFADGLNLGDFTHNLGTPSPATPGAYGDNTGSVTVTYTVQSSCAFTYDRMAAARMAYFLATREEPRGDPRPHRTLTNGIELSPPGPYSAYIMSLSLLAGHLPTLASPTESGRGWYPSWDALARLLGNDVWRNHSGGAVLPGSYNTNIAGPLQFVPPSDVGGDRLIAYISGATSETLPPSGARDFAIEFSGRPLHCTRDDPATCPTSDVLVPLRNVYQLDSKGVPQLVLAGHLDAVAPFVERFDRGDYLFINSDGETHGFMVIGAGPVIDCDDKILRNVSVDPATMQISYTGPILQTAYNVPYVVDWSGDTKRQRPRPFYCPFLPGPHGEVSYDYWLFVRAPSSGTYDCALAIDGHVFVDDASGTVRCDGGPIDPDEPHASSVCQEQCAANCHAKPQNKNKDVPWTPFIANERCTCE